jgi:hypothetical protein
LIDKTVTYKYESKVAEKSGEKKEKKHKNEGHGEEVDEVIKKRTVEKRIVEPDGERITEKVEKVEKREEIREPGHHHLPPPPPPPTAPLSEEEVIRRITTTKTTTIDPPDHHHHHQDLAVMVPDRHRHSDAMIRREIEDLEAERKALRLERAADWRLVEAERLRDGEWELVERERERDRTRPRNVIRVEKDRKGRMALVRSAH